MKSLRKVSVLKSVYDSDVKRSVLANDYEASFHGFFNDDEGNIVALVEKEDGSISHVYTNKIKFIKEGE